MGILGLSRWSSTTSLCRPHHTHAPAGHTALAGAFSCAYAGSVTDATILKLIALALHRRTTQPERMAALAALVRAGVDLRRLSAVQWGTEEEEDGEEPGSEEPGSVAPW